MKKEDIKNELETLGAVKLAQAPRQNCFLVEPNYLNTLQSDLLQQSFSNSDGFVVPEDFFTKLEQNVLAETSGGRVKKRDFAVPAEYFSELETTILSKTSDAETPVIRMNQLRNQLKIWSGVAAAFIIGFLLFNPSKPQECVTFACLLEQSQLTEDDFLQVYDADFADELLESARFTEELDVEEESLIEYLIEEDIDLEVLTNTIES